MRIRVRFAALIAAVGLFAAGAAPADEARMTGIWEGILVCDDSEAGVPVNFVTDDWVEITQRDDGHLRLLRVTQDGATSLLFEGPVVALASSERFEAMVSVCGGSFEAKEMVRLRRVQVNEDGSGSFDAESLFESADAPRFEGRVGKVVEIWRRGSGDMVVGIRRRGQDRWASAPGSASHRPGAW